MNESNQKIFHLLETYKQQPSKGNLDRLVDFMEDEFIIEDLFLEFEKAQAVFENLPNGIIEYLASSLVQDVNSSAFLYFLIHAPLFEVLSLGNIERITSKAAQITEEEAEHNFFRGLHFLFQDELDMALIYFNNYESEISNYFIGLCYSSQDNYENAKRSYTQFLKELAQIQENTPTLKGHREFQFVEYNVLNDLAFCNLMVKNYQQAYKAFQAILKIFSIKEVYSNKQLSKTDEENYDFKAWVNNYLYCLKKLGKYEGYKKVLQFVLQVFPKEERYEKLKQEIEGLIAKNSFADSVLDSLNKPRKKFHRAEYLPTQQLSLENLLEQIIIEQIKHQYQVFDRPFDIYEDEKIYGHQYHIKAVNGRLDLLLQHKQTKELFVVELKRYEAGIEVIDQTIAYMQGLEKELKQEVKGIICLHQAKVELVEKVKQHPKIELYEYQFGFKRIDEQ